MPRRDPPPKVTTILGGNGVMLRYGDAIIVSLENDAQTVMVQITGNGAYQVSGYDPVIQWVKCVVMLAGQKMTMRFCGEQIIAITHFVTHYGTPVERSA